MIRLGISVEGPTEREFVHRVLSPHLEGFGVYPRALDMGGHVSLDRIRHVLPRMLGNFDHVSTLYDFYGFKRRGDYGIEALTAEIGKLVSENQRGKLTPYLQMHEFEALLFAVPEWTTHQLGGNEKAIEEMRRAVAQCGGPEAVNDSPQTSPSHRLGNLFGPVYNKKLHGPEIIRSAGLSAIRAECPRFHAWVSQLEKLGGDAA